MEWRDYAKALRDQIDYELSELEQALKEMVDMERRIVDERKCFYEQSIRKFLVLSLFITSIVVGNTAFADYSVEQIADAIYLAEGGAKTSHPYGILKKYKTTTPRQACINTVAHALKDWNGQGDFIQFLGNRYCPVGAENDPTGLNKNWVGNVTYFLQRG
jgi:hypothetical protein